MRFKPAFPRGVVAVRRRDNAQLDHEPRGVIQRWKHMVHPSGTDG